MATFEPGLNDKSHLHRHGDVNVCDEHITKMLEMRRIKKDKLSSLIMLYIDTPPVSTVLIVRKETANSNQSFFSSNNLLTTFQFYVGIYNYMSEMLTFVGHSFQAPRLRLQFVFQSNRQLKAAQKATKPQQCCRPTQDGDITSLKVHQCK